MYISASKTLRGRAVKMNFNLVMMRHATWNLSYYCFDLLSQFVNLPVLLHCLYYCMDTNEYKKSQYFSFINRFNNRYTEWISLAKKKLKIKNESTLYLALIDLGNLSDNLFCFCTKDFEKIILTCTEISQSFWLNNKESFLGFWELFISFINRYG